MLDFIKKQVLSLWYDLIGAKFQVTYKDGNRTRELDYDEATNMAGIFGGETARYIKGK